MIVSRHGSKIFPRTGCLLFALMLLFSVTKPALFQLSQTCIQLSTLPLFSRQPSKYTKIYTPRRLSPFLSSSPFQSQSSKSLHFIAWYPDRCLLSLFLSPVTSFKLYHYSNSSYNFSCATATTHFCHCISSSFSSLQCSENSTHQTITHPLPIFAIVFHLPCHLL